MFEELDASGRLIWSRHAVRFVFLTAVLVLVAHAVAYLTHEFCHSFTAWLLGFKKNPWALDYGRPDLANILFQQQVDENVDYGPIFATGHRADAALIAIAGPGLGNGVMYFVYLALFRKSLNRGAGIRSLLVFWLAIFSAGNVWSYAPTRTITTHGDMALLAQGLGLSPLALFPLVTLPALYITRSVFVRLMPLARARLFSNPAQLLLTSVTVAYFYFGFFGGSEIEGHYGVVPALFSIVSVLLLLPLSAQHFIGLRDNLE